MLNKNQVKPLKRYRKHQEVIRYSRPLPGDRVQMDVMKVRAKCYQFTAIDDCTRLRVLRLYSSKHAENTVKFLYEVIENMGFPIQRIQTDWGTEFYNELFQKVNKLLVQSTPEAYQFYCNNGYCKMPFNDPDGYETDPRDIEVRKELIR